MGRAGRGAGGGRTAWEPAVGERDRLRGPDSRTGVRTAGRSDMKISEESHGHVAWRVIDNVRTA